MYRSGPTGCQRAWRRVRPSPTQKLSRHSALCRTRRRTQHPVARPTNDNISESNKLELELQCLPAPVNLLTGKPIFKRYTHLKHWNDNSLLLLYQAYDNHCHARGRTCPSRDRPSSGNYLSVMRQVLLSRQYAIQSIVS